MTQTDAVQTVPGVASGATVALVSAATWFILLGDDPASWVVGGPCVALVAWFSRGTLAARRHRVDPLGALRLIPYFLFCSALGGWDVARRVVGPRLAVNPGYVDFRLSLAPGAARTFFVQFIGLLPGTLAAWLEGDELKVHVLETDMDHERQLRAAEARVAAAFGLESGD